MRGTSRESLAAARERLDPVLASPDAGALGDQLFAVAGLLDSSLALRRALTDPARDGQARAELATRLLRGQVSATASDVVAGLVRSRWAEPRDLPDAVEQLGAEAVLASAERARQLEQVEDELFRFSRVVVGDRALLAALDDRSASPAQRGALVERLLGGKVAPATLTLVRQVVSAPRGRRVEGALEDLLQAAAARRKRLVAVVTAAVPLTEGQRQRLTAALGRVYDRQVLLEVDVDPEVVGGLSVQVGGEVLDATIAGRLAQARRRVAS